MIEGNSKHPAEVFRRGKEYYQEVESAKVGNVEERKQVNWKAPPVGTLKLNCYATFDHKGQVGWRSGVRNEKSEIVMAVANGGYGLYNVELAEAMSSLSMSIQGGLKPNEIEFDCLTELQWFSC